LPVGEQRVLDGIESALEGGEPRLRSMFAIFTRLTRDDGTPRTEALRAETSPRRARLAAGAPPIIGAALILGLLAFFIFMAVSSSATPGCWRGPLLTQSVSCQQATGPRVHSQHGSGLSS